MKILSTLFLIIVLPFNLKAQNDSIYFKSHAIGIKKITALSSNVHKVLSPYKLIMLGETSGTNEPATFFTSLVELFTSFSDSVLVGFEIPLDQMNEFLKFKTDSSIYKSDFFLKNANDFRASSALASAISKLNKNKYVNIFFYDVNAEESKTSDSKDKLRYLKIKSSMKAHPKCKTITFGVTVHNMMLPYKGETTTAMFLKKDMELNQKQQFCSLNHVFQRGPWVGGMRMLDDTSFTQLKGYTNYLYIYKNDPLNAYSGVFFTKVVTAATLMDMKK